MRISHRPAAAALSVAALAAFAAAGATPAHAAGGPLPASVQAPGVTGPWLLDGGFESPKATPGSFDTYAAGGHVGPWTVTAGTVDLIGAGYWQAADGVQSLDLDGTSAGGVAQSVATIPGVAYTVSYALAGNPDGGPAIRTGEVLVDGSSVQDFAFDTTGRTPTDMGYQPRLATFRATGPETTLGFLSTTPGSFGPVIDDVRVLPCVLLCG